MILLPSLQTIDGYLAIQSNDLLDYIRAPVLTQIGGSLTLALNHLFSVYPFCPLTSVSGLRNISRELNLSCTTAAAILSDAGPGSLINCQEEVDGLCQNLSCTNSSVEYASCTAACRSSPCEHGGLCMVDSCICPAGYAGRWCELNVDECVSQPCQNDGGSGGTCLDGIDSFLCSCEAGFSGTFCQTSIDYCASQPCQHGGSCLAGLDSYLCQCLPGWSGQDCQTDIDECVSAPCQNEATCLVCTHLRPSVRARPPPAPACHSDTFFRFSHFSSFAVLSSSLNMFVLNIICFP